MQTVVLQININGKDRIVGKIGVCPQNSAMPMLAGHIILYKEELRKNAVSYKLNAIGIDTLAFEKAKEYNIEGLVMWLKDSYQIITVPVDVIDSVRSVDLHEGSQKRIPLVMCKVYENKLNGIPFAWTNNVVTIEPKKGKWIDEEAKKQQALF